jgi:hypothetical protein
MYLVSWEYLPRQNEGTKNGKCNLGSKSDSDKRLHRLPSRKVKKKEKIPKFTQDGLKSLKGGSVSGDCRRGWGSGASAASAVGLNF